MATKSGHTIVPHYRMSTFWTYDSQSFYRKSKIYGHTIVGNGHTIGRVDIRQLGNGHTIVQMDIGQFHPLLQMDIYVSRVFDLRFQSPHPQLGSDFLQRYGKEVFLVNSITHPSQQPIQIDTELPLHVKHLYFNDFYDIKDYFQSFPNFCKGDPS